MKSTIEVDIKNYLKGKDWVWGGKMEEDFNNNTIHKGSAISRTCRAMTVAGVLENKKEQVNEECPKCVMYRIKKQKKFMAKKIYSSLDK